MTTSSLLATTGGIAIGIFAGTMLRGAGAAPVAPETSAEIAAPEVAITAEVPVAAGPQVGTDAVTEPVTDTGILPPHHLGAVSAATSDDRYLLQFGQPFVVALIRDSWTDALVVTALAVEVDRAVIDQAGAEAVLRDRITTSLVRASRAGLFDGAVPREGVTRSVRQVVAEALGADVPRGVNGVIVTQMAKKPVRG